MKLPTRLSNQKDKYILKKRVEKDELGTLSRFKHLPVSSARVLKRCTSKVDQISLASLDQSISAGRNEMRIKLMVSKVCVCAGEKGVG